MPTPADLFQQLFAGTADGSPEALEALLNLFFSGASPDDMRAFKALQQNNYTEQYDEPVTSFSNDSGMATRLTAEFPVLPYNEKTVWLQAFLEVRGFSVGPHGLDGLLGPDTAKALNAWKQSVGLPITDDLLDDATIAAINNGLNDQQVINKVQARYTVAKRANALWQAKETAHPGGSFADFQHDLQHQESGGRAAIMNSLGYVGLYQMGPAALKDLGYYIPAAGETSRHITWAGQWTGKDGIYSLDDFRHSPEVQHRAGEALMQRNVKAMHDLGLEQYIGRRMTLPDGKTFTVTLSGMIAASHLGGAGGVAKFLHSGGRDNRDDGAASIGDYMAKFAGYDVSALTGGWGGPAQGVEVASAQPQSGLPAGQNGKIRFPVRTG